MRERLGDFAGAEAAAAEALALSSPATNARVLGLLVTAARALDTGDLDTGIQLARAAAAEAQGVDEPTYLAARGDLGEALATAGRPDEARVVITEMIADAERLGHDGIAAWGSGQLGHLDLAEGDYESARRVLEPALAHARRQGSYVFEAEMLQGLGYAYLGLERRSDARAVFAAWFELALEASRAEAPDVVVALSGVGSPSNLPTSRVKTATRFDCEAARGSWRTEASAMAIRRGARASLRAAADRGARR